ncbi:MAG: hypothetical protein JWO59_737 [Chloroflexi bacterium]|nr:hypothetical protein [Chloroflexota bacterium]
MPDIDADQLLEHAAALLDANRPAMIAAGVDPARADAVLMPDVAKHVIWQQYLAGTVRVWPL